MHGHLKVKGPVLILVYFVKNIEFYSKNKFEELEHLVGFIIRIYHDARSPEGQGSSAHTS